MRDMHYHQSLFCYVYKRWVYVSVIMHVPQYGVESIEKYSGVSALFPVWDCVCYMVIIMQCEQENKDPDMKR